MDTTRQEASCVDKLFMSVNFYDLLVIGYKVASNINLIICNSSYKRRK
jgi:hypothetical protein